MITTLSQSQASFITRTVNYKVYSTAEHSEWHKLLNRMPNRDIFFFPEYMRLFENLSEEMGQLFVYEDNGNYILYPYFLRRINDLSFYQNNPIDVHTTYFDIVSPYGYSGPVAHILNESKTEMVWNDFLIAFHEYCQQKNIISEFSRLNPFVGNHKLLQKLTDNVTSNNLITFVDLTSSEEEIWQGFNRGNKSNIKKARRSGITINLDNSVPAIDCFYELYCSTMQRNQATDWYFFNQQFFRDCFSTLGSKIFLLTASYQGQIIAAASYLCAGKNAHYFLGGSDKEFFSLRPNNLLMFEAICEAKRRGHEFFNFGGGFESGNSLAQFKASFSKRTKTFFTYKFIHNVPIYDQLNQNHANYLKTIGGFNQNINYFPKYRYVG